MPCARNGFAIMRCAVLVSWPSAGNGSAWVPMSILRRALASASGSWVSAAPDASAWYSRLRLIASWISVAAIGPRISRSSAPRKPPPSSSSELPSGMNHASCASIVIIPASAPATDEMRMSRLYTWDSSWPMTARSSRGVSICTMPSVTATAACRGLRPVANALGCGVGLTYSRGIGWLAACDSSRTIWYSAGNSASLTGRRALRLLGIPQVHGSLMRRLEVMEPIISFGCDLSRKLAGGVVRRHLAH